MKIFKDKKKRAQIIKIAICAAGIYFIEYTKQSLENSSLGRFLTVLEILLLAYMAWTLFSLFKSRAKVLYAKAKKTLVDAVKRLLKPIIEKFRERYRRKQKFVKGRDENKIVFNFNIIEKLKNKLQLRKKLDLKHVSSNAEKIRLLYIKFILKLIQKNNAIKYSSTPKEIKNDVRCGESDILFDIYEKVRYDAQKNVAVLDDTVKLCENAADDL